MRSIWAAGMMCAFAAAASHARADDKPSAAKPDVSPDVSKPAGDPAPKGSASAPATPAKKLGPAPPPSALGATAEKALEKSVKEFAKNLGKQLKSLGEKIANDVQLKLTPEMLKALQNAAKPAPGPPGPGDPAAKPHESGAAPTTKPSPSKP